MHVCDKLIDPEVSVALRFLEETIEVSFPCKVRLVFLVCIWLCSIILGLTPCNWTIFNRWLAACDGFHVKCPPQCHLVPTGGSQLAALSSVVVNLSDMESS